MKPRTAYTLIALIGPSVIFLLSAIGFTAVFSVVEIWRVASRGHHGALVVINVVLAVLKYGSFFGATFAGLALALMLTVDFLGPRGSRLDWSAFRTHVESWSLSDFRNVQTIWKLFNPDLNGRNLRVEGREENTPLP